MFALLAKFSRYYISQLDGHWTEWILKVAGDAAIVEASDGGNVEVKILGVRYLHNQCFMMSNRHLDRVRPLPSRTSMLKLLDK